MPEQFYLDIKENLKNVSRAIDWINDTHLRRYIDAQVTIIHRKSKDLDVSEAEAEAKLNWNYLQE